MADERMLVVTSPQIPGKRIVRTLGMVAGNTIRARGIGKDIVAALRMLVGGEIHEYGHLMSQSREQAVDRMTAKAQDLGANAVISVDFQNSVIAKSCAEMLCYGTAVVVEDD